MPANIQVILQHDVDKLGKSGELVRVRPGFARNYLLPRQLAVPATTAAVNRIEHEKAVALAKAEKAKKEARDARGARSSAVSDQDRRRRPAKTVASSARSRRRTSRRRSRRKGVDVDRKKMQLAEPIKALGTYEIPVKLVSDVTATLKVEVVAK